MDITLEKKDSTLASVRIKLDEDDYQPKVSEKIKQYSKKAQIKGFRPGKVPQGLIRKMYGKSILAEEVTRTVAEALTKYIKDNELKVLGEPMPNQEHAKTIDWENQTAFEFEYIVGLVEDFTISLSKKIGVTKYEIGVTNKIIADAIDDIRHRFGNKVNPEISTADDMLPGLFKQESNDFTYDSVIDLKELSATNVRQFIGKKKGDEVEVDLSKLYKKSSEQASQLGITEEELEKMDLNFVFEIKDIERDEPAEVNQELFDKVFGPDIVKNEEEFKTKIAETVNQNYQRETNTWLNKTIQDAVIAATKIKLPDDFLKDWLKQSGEERLTDADIEKEYESYADKLRWEIICGQLVEENKDLSPKDDEIKAATKKMLEEQFKNMPGLPDEIDTFVNNYLAYKEGENHSKMYQKIREDKILSFVSKAIEIKKKKISLEKFKEIVESTSN